MGRRPCCDKANVKRGPWSSEEDEILKNYVHSNGTGGNWITLPKKAGLKRCGKSCRLRWLNYLRPDIRRGDFTEEEDNIICSLFNEIGSRWSIIASQLSGRTDNEIKNYWNTKLRKKHQAGNITKINENPSTNNYDTPTLNFQNNTPQPNIQQADHHLIFNQSKFQPQPNTPTDPCHGSLINNNWGDSKCDFSGYYHHRFNFVETANYASSSSEINGNNNWSAASSSNISNSLSLGADNNIILSLHEGRVTDECCNNNNKNNVSTDFGSGEFYWDVIDELLLGE